MRKLYLVLIAIICVIIILLVAAFFYIDTHKRHRSWYNVEIDNKTISSVKLDKYVTEGKIIYRSTANTPFHSSSKTHKRKIVLDKRTLRISDYNKKSLGDRTSMDIYLRRMNGAIRFLAIGHSNFAYLDRISVNKDFVLFEEDAPISYASIAAKYNFKKKGIQKFQALTHTFALLPPFKQTISLRMAGEKSITLENKKVDAIKLILKLPDYKEVSIWINKWTHALLLVKNPRINLKVTRTTAPKDLVAKKYTLEEKGYVKKDVSFKNKDILLEGTLSIPEKEGPHPAILLVCGPGPLDRDALGMFTNLSHYLASSGIAVLNFDKRGTGKSHGKFSHFTRNDLMGDLQAAKDFLVQQEEIDKSRIGVLGHSEGGFYASYLASTEQDIAACIIMAGMAVSNIYDTDLESINYFNNLLLDWDKEYLADIGRTTKQTMEIIRDGKDWLLLFGKRVYLRKTRLDLENKPLEAIRKLKIPTLILQGKQDVIILPEHAKLLENALKEGGNQNYKLVFFDKLGHFFGQIVQDGIHGTHLTTDETVMKTILQWLETNLITPKEEEFEVIEVGEPAPLKVEETQELEQESPSSPTIQSISE